MTNEEAINQELTELLNKWDSGGIIDTIEMGGLGPGYEQAIHITIFEMLRELVKAKPSRAAEDYTWEKLDPIIDKAMERLDNLGLSGAQWGAAKSVASAFYVKGYEESKKTFPEDRHIMVRNHFPNLSKEEPVKSNVG